MPEQLDASEVVALTRDETAHLHTEARRIAEPGESSAELAERAAGLAAALPSSVLRALHRFRNTGSQHNALLVRGLLPEMPDLEPTPETTIPATAGEACRAGALTLLAVLEMLGEAFTFASLYEGRLVQHVLPVPGQESAQSSEGSEHLTWHVEDAFTERRCDVFGLLCLRGAKEADTLIAPARTVELPSWAEQVLRQPRFVVAPDSAHGADQDHDLPPTPVLSGPAADPELCFDAVYQRPADPDDHEAAEAWAELARAVDRAAVGHVLSPGELLLADNRRVAHARTVLHPRYDGRDRWLLRAMACASARAHRRRGAVRAVA